LYTVSVRLDGRVVLSVQEQAYPAVPGETGIGLNHIGASTSDERFSGTILAEERQPLGER
jgi:hypothetical protein